MSGNCRQESQYLIFCWSYTWPFFLPHFKCFSHAEPDKYHHCGNPHWALGHFLFDLHEQSLHKFPLQLTLVACCRVTYFVLLSLINKVIQFQNIFSFYPFGRVVEISSGSNYHGISEFPSLWWMAVSSMYVKKETSASMVNSPWSAHGTQQPFKQIFLKRIVLHGESSSEPAHEHTAKSSYRLFFLHHSDSWKLFTYMYGIHI